MKQFLKKQNICLLRVHHLPCSHDTVWKFQNFSIIQILRETKVGDFRGPKIAILTHLEALIFDIYEFLHFLKTEITKLT